MYVLMSWVYMWSGAALLLCCLVSREATAAHEIFIKDGMVVNADQQKLANVLIRDGKIAEVSPDLRAPRGATIIDATGKYVMPGGIDPHTHLDAPMFGTFSVDDFARGQAAALAGGTTMHIDFALPKDHDLEKGFQEYQQKVKKSVMDYSLHMAVTRFDDKAAKDMRVLAKKGINSFKFFMAYKGALQVTDEELIRGFQRCKELGALPMVHAENGDAIALEQEKAIRDGITGPEGHYISRPDFLEDEATYRAIQLAALVNVPLYVVHVMSGGAADHIKNARAAGQRVVGEAVLSGIAASEASVFNADFKVASQFVMSPPIRSEEHQRRVRGALAGQTLQILGTDHCPFNASQKATGQGDFRKIPNGVNGIEARFSAPASASLHLQRTEAVVKQYLLTQLSSLALSGTAASYLLIRARRENLVYPDAKGCLQERLHVAWDVLVNSGLMTPSGFVGVTNTAAALTFNVYPRKGLIAPGSDADVIVFDPELEHTISAARHHSAIDQNIYEGRRLKGKVVTTISQGRVVWDGERLSVTPGAGRFIPNPTFGLLFEGLDALDATYLQRKFPYGTVPVPRDGASDREEL